MIYCTLYLIAGIIAMIIEARRLKQTIGMEDANSPYVCDEALFRSKYEYIAMMAIPRIVAWPLFLVGNLFIRIIKLV